MTYIFVAHKKEAALLFKHFTCKRDKNFSKPLYLHPKFILVITHNGFENAKQSAKELFNYLKPSEEDTLLNFGICAAPKHYSIGECLQVSNLWHKKERVALFHTATPHILESVLEPQTSELAHLVDMESFAIYDIAKAYFSAKNLAFYKIVSDHFAPQSITQELLDTILHQNSATIIETIK